LVTVSLNSWVAAGKDPADRYVLFPERRSRLRWAVNRHRCGFWGGFWRGQRRRGVLAYL